MRTMNEQAAIKLKELNELIDRGLNISSVAQIYGVTRRFVLAARLLYCDMQRANGLHLVFKRGAMEMGVWQ